MYMKSLQDVKIVRPVISEEEGGIKFFFCFLANLLWMVFEHLQKLLSFTVFMLGSSHGASLSQDSA